MIAVIANIFMIISYYLLKEPKVNDAYCPVAPSSCIQSIIEISGKAWADVLLDMFKKTSSNTYFLRFPIPQGGAYIVGDVPTIRAIFQDPKSEKGHFVYKCFENIFGYPSLFTRRSDHSLHKSVRKCVYKSFSSKEVLRMNNVCIKHIKCWMKNDLETYIHEVKPFDPSTEMLNITFDTIMESAFEYPSSSLSKTEKETITKNIQKCLFEFGCKDVSNPFRKLLIPFSKERRDAFQASKDCRKFVQKVLDYYRASSDKAEENTIIKLMLDNDDLKSDEERVAELFTLIIAGYETTGYALSSALIFLAKNPRVTKKLRKELMEMHQADWPKSPYLRCILRESLRLVPVLASGSVRRTSKEFIVQNGPHKPNIIIPKKAVVVTPFMIPFHDPAIFNDPESFHPERWEKGNVTKEMEEAFIPFSLGNRKCVGEPLAIAELYSSIPQLIAKYDFEVETEGKLEFCATLRFDGYRLKARRAEVCNINSMQD